MIRPSMSRFAASWAVLALIVCMHHGCEARGDRLDSEPALRRSVGELHKLHRARSDEVVTVTLGVRQCHVEQLKQLVEDVSDPRSPSYGKHVDIAALASLLECGGESDPHAGVVAWLAGSLPGGEAAARKLYHVRPSGDWAVLTLTVGDAERLFDVELHHFASPSRRGSTFIRAATVPSVPRPISGFVDVILGLAPTSLPARKRVRPHGARTASALATSGSNAPQLMGVLASDTTMYLQFAPLCKDGSPAMNDMCSETAPPSISGFVVNQLVNGSVTPQQIDSCGGGTDGVSAGSTGPTGGVACQNQVPTPGAFLLVNVSLVTQYSDGTESAPATSAAIYTTPFVDAALTQTFYGLPPPDTSGPPFSAYNQSVAEFSHNYFSFNELNEVRACCGGCVGGPLSPRAVWQAVLHVQQARRGCGCRHRWTQQRSGP